MQNCDFRTRIRSLYESQTSPMVFCIQNSDFSIRIACLYVSQPSSVVFEFKSATLAKELQVSMGPSPYLWFLQAKHDLSSKIASLYCSQTSPVVLCFQNNVISIGSTSLYGSLPSSMVFACKTASFGSELQGSVRSSHHLWFCAFTTAAL